MKRLFTLLLPIALSALVSPAYAKDPLVQMLPVRTPGMSPGQVARKAITQSVGQPLFIVGDDARSHRWLRAKQDYLTRIHAVGVVVNVNDARGWRRMTQYGLTVYPVRGDDFANAFGITHYPVLVEDHTVKQ
ncbi:integrating conjugative element protein [Vibrio parahaemolyticus]|uniref:integrating conjugative element protein n=1 Tax=Vibrio parahaemolyticus TaxID=670 RepID=UPI00215C904B|nr:integrating conjugative element protein [Vibrio parahaemolyticus]EGQ8533378.1 integrating conjugative element protein [Vibrio parahaemolyticus]EJB8505127.1 integrating conjugative element protein [Vibrio parahaemolyticus]EJL3960512.1 integrating conjugative element protein [Vibrio parahaemolyticus]MCR9867991.1 integrating conjugative element protein [Vibrio parahaemolyticus]